MTRPMTRRLAILALLALCAPGGAAEEDALRITRDLPAEARPFLADADEVTTWIDGTTRIILLRGQVLVQYDSLRARFTQGALFADLARFQTTGVWHLELHAEGEVQIQDGTEFTQGATAILTLPTRGELKFNAHKGKVRQEARPGEAVYRRAVARRLAPSSVKPVGFQAPGAQPVQNPPATTPFPPLPTPVPPADAVPPPLPTPTPESAAPSPTRTNPLGNVVVRDYTIVPRNPAGLQFRILNSDERTGEKAYIAVGGFLVNVRGSDPLGRSVDLLDIEADRLVLWTMGDPQLLLNTPRSSTAAPSNRELELYLAGNVEVRSRGFQQDQTLRADEVYYDVSRNIAVAVNADLELRQPGIVEPIHFRADEIEKLSPTLYRAQRGQFSASRLPSDPGLKVVFSRATLEERKEPRRSVFRRLIGGAEDDASFVAQSIVQAEDVFVQVENIPVFYLPFVKANARDPLGPIESVNIGANRVYGFQLGVGLDVYELLGMDPVPGTRWRLDVDYLSRRGPALGTLYDFSGRDLFGVPSLYSGQIRLWGLYDDGRDILGNGRGEFEHHPEWRGRAEMRLQVLDLPNGFSVQTQVVGLSDKNFFEQFFKREFDEDPNRETFLYVKQQQDNWAWSLLVEPRLRNWVTETEWLPRGDAYLLGQSFFDLFTYNAHAAAGFARLRTPNAPPGPFSLTDVETDTARFNLMQELSLPFYAGPVKVVPYGVLDLAYYTRDLTGEDNGRIYGGGGVRASLPLTRAYPDVQSSLFNVDGINHKIVVGGNLYVAESSDRFTLFPQLDRLNDDATDQSQRHIRPLQPLFNPSHGAFLATSPLFDPQVYAIRRLVDNRVDTLDQIQVLQMDVRQRWQTKRGFPGAQHIIDWMTLDLSASFFPRKDRDNFGEPFAFLEYDFTWNVGDRTALFSTGWIDPIADGPRVFTIGATLNRTDRTNFFLGYRMIDPVGSHAVSAAATYVFSPKYAMTASSLYDFGTNQSLANSLVLTRMGTDLQVSVGVTYNALQQNFGMTVEVLPNIVAAGRRVPGFGMGTGLLGR